MSEQKVKVSVTWQGAKANHLPAGYQYITVAKFNKNWMNDAWSIVLSFDRPPKEQGNPSVGYAKFLMPNAPTEMLVFGATFELYEGDALVANVQINHE